MAGRPTHINIEPRSRDGSRPAFPSPRGLASPRMPHVDGDIPPQLSPLDAFAAQGRLLAKQLDDSSKNGRRVSRLPPLAIASSLAQARPGYFRSASAENERSILAPPEDSRPGARTQLATPEERPMSYYPRMSGLPHQPSEAEVQDLVASIEERGRSRRYPEPRSYLESDFEESPVEFSHGKGAMDFDDTESLGTGRDNQTLVHPPPENYSNYHLPPKQSRSYDSNTLAIPKDSHGRSGSSIRSVPAESSDDEHTGSMGASFTSLPRRPSASSGFSASTPPRSPFVPPRSPSISSEYSLGGGKGPRSTLNFSRPLSRASRPSFDTSSRQTSHDTQTFLYGDDNMTTPISLNGDDSPELPHDFSGPVPSYIYSRFSLPRGRVLQRNSLILLEDQNPQHQFKWEQPPVSYSNVKPVSPAMGARPPSPPREAPHPQPRSVPKVASPTRTEQDRQAPPRPSLQEKRNVTMGQDKPNQSRPSLQERRIPQSNVDPEKRSSRELTPEDHLAIGIKSHEEGSVHESTYHLRIAAKAGLPTAMLLYALACRHGWGMRPNPKEGVQWLRKAADSASLEVADDEEHANAANPADILEKKARRAQFALSIYELGVSHMNGWGIEQDKGLALRCFEIAGSWGDGDALAEAGFCYAQGVGCKKDLKKSAKFYRQAETKGMSMVGNSWIYKSKYNEDPSNEVARPATREGRSASKQATDSPEKKARNKSRTRSIFGRKKSLAANNQPLPP
ncbi:MAG: hypothetical protein M4579_003444 [Chaenotheca gracillima]|nr:MAG: hypothetical protein M4579_003444 [Chaenotheca gracillima]